MTQLQNKDIWNTLLKMLLMIDSNGGIYKFQSFSLLQRQNYLKQCYEYAATQLMDLENLTPKLLILLSNMTMTMIK